MPNEISDSAPSSLSHLVGQRSVVEQVRTAIDAAQMDARPVDHSLMVGPPGVGKSMLARVVACEMAANFFEVLGQSVRKTADLNALLLQAQDRDVVHLDEAHQLDKAVQTALFLAIDQRKIFPGGAKVGLDPIPLANFTLLLSTTDEHGLLQPLLDRMKLTLRFQFYTEAELVTVVHRRVKAAGWDAVEAIYPDIAKRSRGTPRLALRLLGSARRVARADGATTITPDHLTRACQLEGLDDSGLGPSEQQYLVAVGDGTSRPNVLASLIGLPVRTVTQVIEPFLLRSGLLVKDDTGRRDLTSAGREHLANLRHNRV